MCGGRIPAQSRAPDAFDNRRRCPRHLQSLRVKPDAEHHAINGMHEMAGRYISRDTGAARDAGEHTHAAALTSLRARQLEHLEQRLRDHIELLPLKARQGPLD